MQGACVPHEGLLPPFCAANLPSRIESEEFAKDVTHYTNGLVFLSFLWMLMTRSTLLSVVVLRFC